MSRTIRLGALVAAAAASVLLLSACAPAASEGGTATSDKLVIATGEPAYEPWVVGDDPSTGEGFEAAIGYAVAEELGYAKDDVVWQRTTFDAAIAPGPKDWDLNIQQFSVTDERKQAVDFSSPYYTTSQAVVATSGTDAAKATDLAGLKGSLIGVAAGTTSFDVAKTIIDPTAEIQVFNSVDDVIAAMNSGTIDAFVTDLPGAYYAVGAQLDDGVMVGQLDSTDGGDEFAIVLPKGSKLTEKTTAAVDALRESGKLAELEQLWLADQGAPVLK
jgi:polar amino acid transport system substrate-binding protein